MIGQTAIKNNKKQNYGGGLRRYLSCASIKHKAFSSTAILEEIDIRMFNTALCSAKEGTVYILPYLQVLRQYDFLLSTV